MGGKQEGIVNNLRELLSQDYRGVNIAVYALATAGLAASIYKIRPVSKFSKASKVPNHFIRNHEPLRGVYTGVQHSPVRLLVNHKAPIYLPLWHSSKPPLPVKLWGVEVVSGNAVNWLECVAKGKEVTLKPIGRENDDLVSTVLLHLPRQKEKTVETIDVGKTLVELGFAKATVPKTVEKNTFEWRLAPVLLSAESRAKSYRNGVWSDILPPVPIYVVAWRKGTHAAKELVIFSAKTTKELVVLSAKSLIWLLAFTMRSALAGVKYIASRPFRASPKQVQAT
ncbi:hypothetical protein NE865_11400 [Phthorimaea operculella]|nr:hypothetical protein NE865_11400 [Phthorimaea operculella]